MSLSLVLVPIVIGISSGIKLAMSEKVEDGAFYKLQTNMKDNALLAETLRNYGCQVTMDEEQLQSSLGDTQLGFQLEEDGTFSAVFSAEVVTKDAKELMTDLQEEYSRLVQKQTYEKLLQRASKKGLLLESENTNQEDTIVLTFQVKEQRNYE
ncbi:DUF1257 domain-containing protein [Amphibacillus jilinensis]|uniref:DUF1257 domain-containing protein n=1 Tax=Amphibacillus jilinensis TaxID=1216008 RepID=UPI0002DD9102|nr:DUF1257 domain-containing protein [Amphibacillus jilinensis]